ncbi:hypothetical protein AB0G04_00905 [Actinoplanes sp. NPDC023801]|uniref:hypothetical protein n=1 Tax=Actinoplanes sp. NPDC023801 TaxID=3154595 RepID=UPI0033D168AF
MTPNPQTMLVVEYPCDRFCRIELDLSGERGQITLQQLRDKADKSHQREHEPEAAEAAEAEAPAAHQETAGRPAATVFLSAPGRDLSAPGRDTDQRRRGR